MSIPTTLQLCSAVTAWLPDVPARVLKNFDTCVWNEKFRKQTPRGKLHLMESAFFTVLGKVCNGVLRVGVHILFFHSDTQLYLYAYCNSVCTDEEVVAFPYAQHCHVQMFCTEFDPNGKTNQSLLKYIYVVKGSTAFSVPIFAKLTNVRHIFVRISVPNFIQIEENCIKCAQSYAKCAFHCTLFSRNSCLLNNFYKELLHRTL